jgi:hypothetical protein
MTDDLHQHLAEAVRRQSLVMLDNVGIRVDVRKLPAASALHSARRRKNGTHWLARVWCQTLRPILAPAKQKAIDAAFDAAQVRVQTEFMDAVLRQGTELMAAL